MTDLYDLTRKLVRRGCPEHPRLRYSEKPWYTGTHWGYHDEDDGEPLMAADESDARAIWTLWALEWALGLAAEKKIEWDRYLELRGGQFRMCMFLTYYGPTGGGEWPHKSIQGGVSDILEAIEASTRHLEPTND